MNDKIILIQANFYKNLQITKKITNINQTFRLIFFDMIYVF